MKAFLLQILILLIGTYTVAQEFETVYPEIPVRTISSISIHESGIGYAPQECGSILRSEDFGASWSTVDLPLPENSTFSSVHFLNPDNAAEMVYRAQRDLLYTDDDFSNVTSIKPSDLSTINSFVVLNNGRWVVAGNGVAYSDDKGQSWTMTETADVSGRHITEHNGIVYASSSRGVFRSADGARTFTEVIDNTYNMRKVVGRGDQLFAVSLQDNLFRSYDDGISWEEVPAQNFFGNADELTFYNDSTLLSSSSNRITYSTDGGLNWVSNVMPVGVQRTTCNFVGNDGTVYIGGEGSQIFGTPHPDVPLELFHGFQEKMESVAAHSNEVVAVGPYGALLYSQNQGEDWTFQITGDRNFNLVRFLDDQAFVSNDLGQLLQFIPGQGLDTVLETSEGIEDILYSTADGLSYVLTTNTLYKSTDKGQRWNEHYTFPENARRIKADHAGNLYVLVGDELWWSVNGGGDFEPYVIHPDPNQSPRDFLVIQFNTIYMLDTRNIYLSTDAGQTFIQERRPYNGVSLYEGTNDRIFCLGTNSSNADLYITDLGTIDFRNIINTCSGLAPSGFWDETTETFWACAAGREVLKLDLSSSAQSSRRVPPTNVSIYPNPATDQIFLQNEELNITSWEIFSLTGQSVHQGHTPVINIQHLMPGQYIVLLSTNKGLKYSRLIKN